MKNSFLKSVFILLIGGFFTKLLGFIIKIFYTRNIGIDGVALYSLIAPTYSLLITLANFNIQLSISKRISGGDNSKKVLVNSCYIMLILDIFLILLTITFSKFISINLLHNTDALYPIIAISFTLPFVSIGYIVKGYFYGKQNMFPHMLSNVIEQLVKLTILLILLPKIIVYGSIISVLFLILINIITESVSLMVFYFFLPKNFNVNKNDLKYDKSSVSSILSLSIPSISGRLIGNIGYFLEPIVLTKLLLLSGYSIGYITKEYGIYNAYSISLLLFPSFFIGAISSSLLPEVSRLRSNSDIKSINKRIKDSLLISLFIGIICTLFIYIYSPLLLFKLYKTSKGVNYIRIMAPFFVLYYLEGPLASILFSFDKVKVSMFITLIGIIIKIGSMSIFCLLGYGIYSLVYSEIIDIVVVTFLEFIFLYKTKRTLN